MTDLGLISYLLNEIEDKKDKMPVTLRTKQRCSICNKPFRHIEKFGFICPEHKTIPTRFFIDVSHKGRRVKIYSDKMGKVLDSYNIALETADHIKYECRHYQFDPTKYIKKDINRYLFQNLIQVWLKAKKELISAFK